MVQMAFSSQELWPTAHSSRSEGEREREKEREREREREREGEREDRVRYGCHVSLGPSG